MKTKLIMILLLIAGVSFKITKGQTYYFNKVMEREYGGFANDYLIDSHGLLLDKDSNIILTSSSISGVNGNKTVPNCGSDTADYFDYWLLKLNQNGNIIFQQRYGGASHETGMDAAVNNYGSILIGGVSGSKKSCEKSMGKYGNADFWLIKVDSAGQKIWDQQYGTHGEEVLNSIVTDDNGGYLLVGYNSISTSGGNITVSSHGNADILAVKIDSSGLIQWDNLYGGNSNEWGSAIKDVNGNYLLYGYTDGLFPSGDVSDTNTSYPISSGNNWLIKIDPLGNKMWDKRLGCFQSSQAVTAIQNENGQYVIASDLVNDKCLNGNLTTDTFPRGYRDIIVYTLDSANGNMIFNKRIGANLNEQFRQILQMRDNGYLFVGLSNSNVGFDKTEPNRGVFPNAQSDDVWLVRTDSLFNIMWDKTIGGTSGEAEPNLLLINDSTFILACTSYSNIGGDKGLANFDTSSNTTGDIWLTKWTVSTINGIAELTQPQFSLYPNPAKNLLYVSPKKQLPVNTMLSVIDMQGRVLKEEKVVQHNSSTLAVDVSTLSQGVYLLRLNGQVQRFVKL